MPPASHTLPSPLPPSASKQPNGRPPATWSAPAGPAKASTAPPPATTNPFAALATQNDARGEGGAAGEAEDEEGEAAPGSPSVKRAEEEGVEVLHEARAKLWIQEGGQWKARGAGAAVLKLIGQRGKAEGAGGEKRKVLLFRNDAGKVLLNASLPRSKGPSAVQKKTGVTTALFCAAPNQSTTTPIGQVVPTTVLFRFGNEEEAASFKKALDSSTA